MGYYGGTIGTAINSDDIIELKAQVTRWSGHDGYLSSCGSSNVSTCRVNVTLRPDSGFLPHESNSMLRKWKITTLLNYIY